MTVFGFGRVEAKPQLTVVPQRFTIGLVETRDYKVVKATVEGLEETQTP